MKVELRELGDNKDPYLVLTATGVMDAVTVGSLVEKFALMGLPYSSNIAVLTEETMPYVSIRLAEAPIPVSEHIHDMPAKFKQEQERKDGKTS